MDVQQDALVTIDLQVCEGCEDLPLPAYQTEHAVGMDLRAAIGEMVTIKPGERRRIPSGIRLAIPPGYEGQVRPRSGLAFNDGIILPNAPGTIDPDFRGEIEVILMNLGQSPFIIRRGDRIAQLVICPVTRCAWQVQESLDKTERAEGGFGHTGISD